MSSPTRKLARNPKRKGFPFKKSSRTVKHSSAYKLRRNSRVWQAMHPGKDGWKLSPPIPGTQVGQDLYIARIVDPDGTNGYGVFRSRRDARDKTEHVVWLHDAADARHFEKKYSDVYKFHRLTSVRSGGRSRFGS